MVLLGAIREIRDYELKLNLANNVVGTVPITQMADCYTGLLKRFAQSSGDAILSDVSPLIAGETPVCPL